MNRQYCRACGTDVPGFAALAEVAGRMEKYRGEKRWDRVLKEAELAGGEVRLPGEQGQQLQRKVADWQKEGVAKAITAGLWSSMASRTESS